MVIRGGRESPPHKGLVVHDQLIPGHFRWPRHLGQRPRPPDQVPDKVLRPPLARRGPWLEARLVADRIPWEGPAKSSQGKGLQGRGRSWSRCRESPWLAWSPRPAAMRAARTARCTPYRRYTNSSKSPHPLRQPEGEDARLPQVGRPLVRRPKLGEGRRRVSQPGTPCLPSLLPLRAVPQDVDLVLVRRPAVGAR